MSRPYDREAWARARAAAPSVSFMSGLESAVAHRERLDRYIDGHLANAAGRGATGKAYLIGWANFIDRQIAQLAAGRTLPIHLQGLDAITLANARDRLLAGIPKDKP